MSLSHSDDSNNFPSDQQVEKAMETTRSLWAAKGLDLTTCRRLNHRLQEISLSP